MKEKERKQPHHAEQPREPVNVVDGIPDRSPRPAAWKYVAILVGLLGWLGFLIYCQLAGNL